MSNVVDAKVFAGGLRKKQTNAAIDHLEFIIKAMATNGCENAGYLGMVIASAREILTPAQFLRMNIQMLADPENEHRIDGFIINYEFAQSIQREILRVESIGIAAEHVVSLVDPVRLWTQEMVKVIEVKDNYTVIACAVMGHLFKHITTNPDKFLHYEKIGQKISITIRRKDHPGCVRLTTNGTYHGVRNKGKG